MHKLHTYKVSYSFYIEAHDPEEAEDYVKENFTLQDEYPDDIKLLTSNAMDCPESDCVLLEMDDA